MQPLRTLALLVPAFLAPGTLPAQAAEPAVPAALYGSEAEARGDFGTWLTELLDAFAAEPDSPYAKLTLDKIRGLTGHAEDRTLVAARLQPVLDAGIADAETLEALQDVLAARARAAGDFDRGDAYGGNAGYLRRFAAVGPFGWSEDALIHKSFDPESAEIDPAQPFESSRGAKSWLTLPILGASPWVQPFSQLRRGGRGVTYSMARVRPAGAGTVALKVYCSTSFKVFVNGEEVHVADRVHDRLPNPVWFTAHLADGWNRLVVKLAGSGSFGIKACDPATGLPLDGIEEGDPLSAEAAPPAAPPADPLTYRTPLDRAVAAAADDDDALRLAAAAQLLNDNGYDWKAYVAFEKAAALATALPAAARANITAAYGRFLASFGPFPDVQRKLRAKPQFEAAAEAFPGHVSATVRLARYLDEDDRPDKAVKSLQKLVSEQGSATAWMALADISRKRGWEREAQTAAEAAAGLAPNLDRPLLFLADLDKRYANHDSRIARMRQLREIDASDGRAIDALIDSLRAQGKDEEALDMLRTMVGRWPESVGYRRQLAQVLTSLGEEEEAIRVWEVLRERTPEEAGYASEIAHLRELLGDAEGAAADFEKSLALAGHQPELWRRVRRLRNEVEDFAEPYEPDVAELLASLPNTEELRKTYPKAVAVTVLDHTVTRVRPDGSAESFVHMIYKLLDEKGVAKYGNVSRAGETREIRTILPDGTEMAPTGLGGGSFNMEGLVPGSIIEHRYYDSARAGRDGYDGGQFYFQDFDLRRNPNPVLLTRFVVLAPKNMQVPYEKHLYEGDPEIRDAAADHVATIWEKRDMPRIEWEQSMPERDEIIPHVDYSPAPDMEDANWEYLGARDDSRPSPVLEEAFARAVPGTLSDTETLHALHDFVNREITGDFAMGSGPAAILLEKAGDRTQLFEALVRMAGIPYRQGRAMANTGDGRDLTKPTSRVFSTPFLWLEPRDGPGVAYFSGARHAPFGLVPAAFRDSFAYLASTEGGEIVRLPAGGVRVDDGSSFVVHLGDAPEATTLSGTVFYRSPNGYRFKRSIEEMSQDDRRKFAEREISGYFASPALTEHRFPDLERHGEPLRVWVAGDMPQYLSRQGDLFVASLGLPATDMTGRFVQRPEREYDLILNPHQDRVDEIEIHLGDAFEVVTLPEDHLAVHELGVYSLTWRRRGGVVTVRRERHFQPARYTPDAYPGFVEWCKDIDDAETRKLELRRIP